MTDFTVWLASESHSDSERRARHHRRSHRSGRSQGHRRRARRNPAPRRQRRPFSGRNPFGCQRRQAPEERCAARRQIPQHRESRRNVVRPRQAPALAAGCAGERGESGRVRRGRGGSCVSCLCATASSAPPPRRLALPRNEPLGAGIHVAGSMASAPPMLSVSLRTSSPMRL